MSRYADLSTSELDRLIALEERRMDRERGVAKQKDRCAALGAFDTPLLLCCRCAATRHPPPSRRRPGR